MNSPPLAITVGEPAGIGPELVALLGVRQRAHPCAARLVVLGDCDVLHARAARIGSAPAYIDHEHDRIGAPPRAIEIWHHPVVAPVSPGRPDPANARSVLAALARACDACATGAF